jgi:hypothetical protein
MHDETLAPVLRVQDAGVASAWYRRLGFELEFEHSSGPALNRTQAVLKRGDLVLLLSNAADAPPSGAFLHLRVADIGPIATEFAAPIERLQGGALVLGSIFLKPPRQPGLRRSLGRTPSGRGRSWPRASRTAPILALPQSG